jgi:hypothetical protein
MQDLNPILLIAGFAIGTLSVFLPAKLWLRNAERIRLDTFKRQFSQKKGLLPLIQFLPLAWLIFHALFLFPKYFNWFGLGYKQAYFFTYLLIGGIGLCDGLFEMMTKVSPIRGFVGRSLQVRYLIYDPFIRRFGLLRVACIVGVGMVSWLVIEFSTILLLN